MITNVNSMSFFESMAHRGRSFEAYDLVASLNGVQYYLVQYPSDKTIYLQARTVAGDGGPIFYEVYPGAVLDAIGTPMILSNLRAGGHPTDAVISRCTITGPPGDAVVKVIARGETGGGPKATPSAGGAEVLSIGGPGGQAIVGIRTLAAITNVELRYVWAEGDPMETINA